MLPAGSRARKSRTDFEPAAPGLVAHGAPADRSYGSFRRYLDTVFTYAGTASLVRELRRVPSRRDLRAGDVFVHGGHPGHAVLVVDVAESGDGQEKAFLLAQSYMPAQDIHILKNPGDARSPWYSTGFGETLRTPEWTFAAIEQRRF
ncbi:MAG: hypothetical protein JXQ29_12055 [Planctomycetes bacterium]|nr:hypothetical protein [Planctomycetota bacterium]